MPKPPSTTDPSFWREGHFKLFITHLAKHKVAAETLRKALLDHHISGFVAHSDIAPALEWQDEILRALNTADALVALLHKGFRDSYWTDQEIGIALGRGLLPLSISYSQAPYGFIGRYQALPGRGKSYEDLSKEVFTVLKTRPQTRRRIAEATVHKFSESGNFEQAKRNMTLLESLEYWDASLTKLAKAAAAENGQITDAWGVPQRLETHIKRWKQSESPF